MEKPLHYPFGHQTSPTGHEQYVFFGVPTTVKNISVKKSLTQCENTLASITAATVPESHDAFSALVLDSLVIAQAHVFHICALLNALIDADHQKENTQNVQPD
ncbi:hypothetical protein EPUL_004195 [Erysiphe pulchra]|uniref:Uncharacterized protein n=1 Tax=Erysiphe pulchra TaxID=225359 RepID=A0A2S4PQ67_9PEZI|nr:hypothetical protein EPUL_004195 [Erysiphe pulchra]